MLGRLTYTCCISGTGTGTTKRSLLEITPVANQRVTVLGMDIGLGGNDPSTTPIPLTWSHTSAGLTTGDAVTKVLVDRGMDETPTSTVQTTQDFLVGGGGSGTGPVTRDGTLIHTISLHQQGTWQWRPVTPLIAKGSEVLTLYYNSATYVAVNCTVWIQE